MEIIKLIIAVKYGAVVHYLQLFRKKMKILKDHTMMVLKNWQIMSKVYMMNTAKIV